MPEVKRVSAGSEVIMDPLATLWAGVQPIEISLQPTPVGMQPSEYILSTVKQESVGMVKGLLVSTVHDRTNLYFRLEWADPTKDADISEPHLFPDGTAIMFPFGQDAPLATMGSEKSPVNQWHWQAGGKQPYNVTTAGLGTTYRTSQSFLESRSIWEQGRWKVVIARPIKSSDPANHVPFSVGTPFKAAFCVWEGSNKERAGLKAFSLQWTDFTWEA